MNQYKCIDLSNVNADNQPFPHFSSSSAFHSGIDMALFQWFEITDEWILTKTDFYEQYEFSFLSANLPDHLQCLISMETIETIETKFKHEFGETSFDLVGIMAHKLVNNQRIGIHNDYINDDETHRLVIQINQQWTEDKGGFLMLFSSDNVNSISKVINPINNSAVGFEISPRSHHAVSKIFDFNRYTIVYTFKQG